MDRSPGQNARDDDSARAGWSWAEAEQLAGEARGVPEGAPRSAFLASRCGGNTELRVRVEALLGVGGTDPDMLKTTAVGLGARSGGAGGSLSERPGQVIGPYKLLQQLGEGGFGAVFMAEQERPVRRKVALKILKLGMDTGEVVARFEQERQALALMDHPGIAKVLDAGATEAGRPFFVMELVKGDPIVEYCSRNGLGVRERLELLAGVCEAVQHAHTKGVIHRDLKPSNVLVSAQDGRAAPKVIDFGIAKATAAKLTERTLFTEHRALMGTPEYMSPEQAEGSLDIDTRSDVYALGVMLYELLTGTTPFSSKALRSGSYAEVQRIIREVDPPAPSARLTQIAGGTFQAPTSARGDTRRLATTVRGELDWIVMKAMEKDRSRRYDSASAMARDIRRYLAGETISAAPPSTAYRASKFVRRNRGTIVAAGLVLAALVLGMVGTTVGLVNARGQQRLAEQRLAESEATVKFLDDMLAAADPSAQGKDVTVRAVVEKAAGGIGSKFADRPLLAAKLHQTIGRTFLALGEYAAAEEQVGRAVELYARGMGPDSRDTRRAELVLGEAILRNGKLPEAESRLKRAAEDNRRLFGPSDELAVAGEELLGQTYSAQSRYEEAAKLQESVVAARRGGAPEELLQALSALATTYGDINRFEEADKLFTEAAEIAGRVRGPEHPQVLTIKSDHAWMLYWWAMELKPQGDERYKAKVQQSREMGEAAAAGRARVLGEEHPDRMSTLNNLAAVYRELNMFQEADAITLKDIEVSVRLLGEEHPNTITAIANMGNSLRTRKRCDEALVYLERALRSARKSLPPDAQGTAFILGWSGSCLRELGRFAEAEPRSLEARAMIVRLMGEDHRVAAAMASDLRTLYERWDKAEPGKGYAEKAAEWAAKAPARPE